MTTLNQNKEKTELQQALDTFRGYHQAHHRHDPSILLNEIWEWARALESEHPFLHAKKSHGQDTVMLDIRLGKHTEGRLVANLIDNGKQPIFQVHLDVSDSQVCAKLRFELNHDGMFFARKAVNNEEIRVQKGLLNQDYLNYLLGRLLAYLIECLEPNKFTSPTT